MKIWVVEQYHGHGKWLPMNSEDGEIVGSVNFYHAHQIKRELVDMFWCLTKQEERDNFRVSKYAPKK